MGNTPRESKPNQSTDLVLQEIWRIKDTLCASYGHDVDRLFAGARERQKHSGHPVVNLQSKRRKEAVKGVSPLMAVQHTLNPRGRPRRRDENESRPL